MANLARFIYYLRQPIRNKVDEALLWRGRFRPICKRLDPDHKLGTSWTSKLPTEVHHRMTVPCFNACGQRPYLEQYTYVHAVLTCGARLRVRSKQVEMKRRGADSAARGTPLANSCRIEAEQLDANRGQAGIWLAAAFCFSVDVLTFAPLLSIITVRAEIVKS
jgi:hypothetical protein